MNMLFSGLHPGAPRGPERRNDIRNGRRLWGILLGAFALGLAGCDTTESVVVDSGPRINSREDMNPTADPPVAATVTSAGTTRQVSLCTDVDGESYSIDMLLHDESYDQEVYDLRGGAFSIAEAAGERYEPPIPILKFPMVVGEPWEWSGQMSSGSVPVPATGTIETFADRVYVCGMPVDCVIARVKLVLDATSNAPILREMTFYFSPDKGLFKREYGTQSIREPDCSKE
jgi:hypothetical protein